ncbi:MAG: SPFH domain-containing protein [Clostridia bacterium]|nr:SPFH domain-containing protein [Clostridia bacterium]
MGLIAAAVNSIGGVLADQWKEFFYCEAMPKDVLMTRGVKQITGRSSNTKGNDNIISNGSGIAVADGQFMIIVEQGKVVEFCGEPGQYTWNTSSEPSLFAGKFGQSLIDTFKAIGARIGYGGDTGKDQRVYYFNTLELMDNKFGTATPIPFRVVDTKNYIDRDVDLRLNGTYSYRITNPLLFYTNVCGNVSKEYRRSEIEGQLKAEFMDALMPAVGKLSELELRPNQLMLHTTELRDNLNKELTASWSEKRGLSIVNVSLGAVTLSEEDQKALKEDQRVGSYMDPNRAAGLTTIATANAIQTAAGNPNGAMNGIIGVGGIMNVAGGNTANLYAMGADQRAQQAAQQPAAAPADAWKCVCGNMATGKFCAECGAKKPEAKPANSWTCTCGAVVTGNFCPECGAKKPEEQKGWTCSCGSVNLGKFCPNCGAKKPADAPLYRCDKCGWEPADPKNPPKFCPQCGDRFDENDIR